MPLRIRVEGYFEFASKKSAADIILNKKGNTFAVKPLYSRRSYTLPLDEVLTPAAEKVVRDIIRSELPATHAEEKKPRRRRFMAKRGLLGVS